MTKIEEVVKVIASISNQILMNGVVAKALKNGFRWQDIYPGIPTDIEAEILHGDERIRLIHPKSPYEYVVIDYPTLFFSHAFAKAFFGKKWKKHLKTMVLEEYSHHNRLEYFRKFLREDYELIQILHKRERNYQGGVLKEANCYKEIMRELEEVKEMAKEAREDYRAGRFKKVRDLLTGT